MRARKASGLPGRHRRKRLSYIFVRDAIRRGYCHSLHRREVLRLRGPAICREKPDEWKEENRPTPLRMTAQMWAERPQLEANLHYNGNGEPVYARRMAQDHAKHVLEA